MCSSVSRLSVHSLPLELTLTGRHFSKRMVTSWGVEGAVIGSLVLVTVRNQVHLAPKKARVLTEGSPKVVEEMSGHVAAVRNVVIHAV